MARFDATGFNVNQYTIGLDLHRIGSQGQVIVEINVIAGLHVVGIAMKGASQDAAVQLTLANGHTSVGTYVLHGIPCVVDMAKHQIFVFSDYHLGPGHKFLCVTDIGPFGHGSSNSYDAHENIMCDFNRYRSTLTSLATEVLNAAMAGNTSKGGGPDRLVLMGAAAAKLMLEDDTALHGLLADGFRHLAKLGGRSPAVHSDPAGQFNDVYFPLVLHLHLAAFGQRYETLDSTTWGACEQAIPAALQAARQCEQYAQIPPDNDRVDVVLWQALCVLEQAQLLKRDIDAEWIDAVVHQILSKIDAPQLHQRNEDESIDAWMGREMAGLHAMANLALATRNQAWARRVQKIAMYHVKRRPVVNAADPPWALFAFSWSQSTRAFAEQWMQSIQQHREAITPLAAMLVADAANALGSFRP